jgi:RNA polymerase subunit RPABC4/transcription elongation factor Spt4
MDDILTSLGLSNNAGLAIIVYIGLVCVAFWIAMIIWVYRDMRVRSRDIFAQLAMTVIVAVLTAPGWLIYLLLRPRETLSEAYERSLEEEALLQEIEEKSACPGCGQNVQDDWQACPHCHTRLKKPCVHCHKMLELSWQICPYCTTNQPGYTAETPQPTRYVRPTSIPEGGRTNVASNYQPGGGIRATEPVEFVEGDEY